MSSINHCHNAYYNGYLFYLCFIDILLQFGSSSYDVNENNGPAQPVLTLDGPLECCSISVTVKVEDISAKGKNICIWI